MTPQGTEPASIEVGKVVEAAIHDLSSEGAGVGRLPDGRTLFVHRTAPGDRARARVTHLRSRWGRGRLERLLEEGPGRRAAPCRHYATCGGCVLEHLDYSAQLEAKANRVRETLARIGGRRGLPALEVHPSPREFRYRNRASFTLRRLGGDRVVAGFHALEAPGRIVDLGGECLLLEEGVARAWDGIRSGWGPGAGRLPAGPRLRLTVRATADGDALLLVEGGRESEAGPPGAEGAGALLAEVPTLRAVWWVPDNPGGGSGAEPGVGSGIGSGAASGGASGIGSQEARLLAGDDGVEEVWFGERVPIRPGAFLQVNRWAATFLHELVLREVGGGRGRRVLDAYCGFGVYGRCLARHGAEAVGIELSPEAVAMADARPVPGFRILAGRVEERLHEALPVDRAILNPPRQGVAPGVMEALAEGVGERIVYVSCDPATLARDLAAMGTGFRVERIQLFDLFPQTAHVEAVVTLVRTQEPDAGTGAG